MKTAEDAGDAEGNKIKAMSRHLLILCVFACAAAVVAQNAPPPNQPPQNNGDVNETTPMPAPGKQTKAPPLGNNESSSKAVQVDLQPPASDLREHPEDNPTSDVHEMHPWNPLRAMKAVEVGDYYFHQGNLLAAISRYREALYYKDNDADAALKLGQALEKNKELYEARQAYELYLKILPQGKDAEEVKKALARIPKDVKPTQNEPAVEKFEPEQ
jgi:tetratricopeptide (TPR) repeat protein